MDYSKFETSDFVTDERFLRWIHYPDEAENVFWKDFISKNPAQSQRIDDARQWLMNLQAAQEDHAEGDEELSQRMWHRIENQNAGLSVAPLKQKVRRLYLWYAAAAAVVLLAFFWGTRELNKPETDVALMESPNTEHAVTSALSKTIEGPRTFVLADGSKIQLGANSALSFPENFDKKQREVFLVGEAFFDVARRPEQPFIVKTSSLITRVLGTSFRVISNDQDKNHSVDVKTGSVAVFLSPAAEGTPGMRKSVTLSPNQKVVFDAEHKRLFKSITEKPLPIEKGTEKNYDDIELSEVFKGIEKMYGIKVSFDHKKFEGCSVTTSIGSLSLFDHLDLLSRAFNFTYTQIEGKIIVAGEGCQ